MTKVIIVDDQISIREFLKISLANEPDLQVVGLADNGRAAITQVEKHNPDIVLMDIDMPGMGGIEATEIITKRFAVTKVVLFTSQDDRQQLNLALKVGARGYILKNTSTRDIANIIRLTEKGFFQIGPILTSWDYAGANSEESELQYSPNQIIPASKHSKYSDESGGIAEMNHVLSSLTNGLFQLQKTIQSQENTIVHLTNQYTEVQQEIRTRLGDKRLFDDLRSTNYKSGKVQKSLTERRQNFLFISSFFLGVITVTLIIGIITILKVMIP
jgi:DNA-binding NarL/FixJ family response regulator